MFTKKISLYNRTNGKKDNSSKVFLFVILFVVLVIVFVQSLSISQFNNEMSQTTSINIDNKEISNNNNNNNNLIINKNNENINKNKEDDEDSEDYKDGEDDEEDDDKESLRKQHQEFKEAEEKANKGRSLPYSTRSYATRKPKPKTEEQVENERLTLLEKENLRGRVLKEFRDEVEILKKLDFDPGYASILDLPDYKPPTGDELVMKVKDTAWKLTKEENPFYLPKPHIFIHVPKAAGSSLGGIFKRNEKRDKFAHHWKHPSYSELESTMTKDSIFGHIRYGLHFYFQENDPTRVPENPYGLNKYSYMTMLREPVDRVISNYYYHRQNRKDPFHDLAMNNNLTEWIKVAAAGNNEQARMICGMGWEDFGNQTIYDMALHHLKYTFKFVGITEHFTESLVLLSHYSGFQNIRYSKINTGRQRVSVDKIPDDLRKEIEDRNWIDVALYKMALDIYNKQIDQIGREFFEQEVAAYKDRYLSGKYKVPNILQTTKPVEQTQSQ
ncbi:hypothetical protein ACTFIV_000502 [Dictyostelium citrinum]